MVLFKEKQKFRQWWVWAIVITIGGLFLYRLYRQLILKIPLGEYPSDTISFIIGALIPLTVIILFLIIRLETEITEEGIVYKFFPFHIKPRIARWEFIDKSYVRTYSPIFEYGGWGIRLGIFGYGRALNISGDKGLQLVFSNGKKLLIGTQRPEELQQALIDIHKLKIDKNKIR